MMAWVAGVVRVMRAGDLRGGDALGQDRERLRRIVARLHLQRRPVDGRPSSRGGVPVLSRPSAKPSALKRLGKADRRRLADPARRQSAARRYGSGRAGTCRSSAPPRRAANIPAVASRTPVTRPSARRVVRLALDHRRDWRLPDRLPAWPRRRACGRPARAGRAPPAPCGG